MPDMGGFQLYNEMKKVNRRVRVCFITAFDIQQTDMETITSSNKKSLNLIRKPITIEEMVEEIRKQLR
jgi:DNA-binding NtrC family response regulator